MHQAASISAHPETTRKIFTILKGSEFGPHVDEFNRIVSEYFQSVFHTGGEKYLERFPIVEASPSVLDPEILSHITTEISNIISPYGNGSMFSVVKNSVSRRSPNQHRIHIHLFLGFLRLTQTLDLEHDKTEILKAAVHFAGTDGFRRSRKRVDAESFRHVTSMIVEMNRMFGSIGVEISAKYLELIDGLARAGSGIDSSELFVNISLLSWSERKNQTSRFLGAVYSAITLCENRYSTKWTVKPFVCEAEFGGKFLLHVLTQIALLRGDGELVRDTIHNADMPIWYVFSPDFIFNRLNASPGSNTSWTLGALLEIFKSNLSNFRHIARNKDSFVVTLFKQFVKHPVGDYLSPFLDPQEVQNLESFLGNQILSICRTARDNSTPVIARSTHCNTNQ